MNTSRAFSYMMPFGGMMFPASTAKAASPLSAVIELVVAKGPQVG
ncbi:hypothetical protein [Bradyrhizobium sp. 2S1]